MTTKTKTFLSSTLKVLKDTAILIAAITVIFTAGKMYNKIETLEERSKKAVYQDEYKLFKQDSGKVINELKEQNNKEHKAIQKQLDTISFRTDSIYELLLKREMGKNEETTYTFYYPNH